MFFASPYDILETYTDCLMTATGRGPLLFIVTSENPCYAQVKLG